MNSRQSEACTQPTKTAANTMPEAPSYLASDGESAISRSQKGMANSTAMPYIRLGIAYPICAFSSVCRSPAPAVASVRPNTWELTDSRMEEGACAIRAKKNRPTSMPEKKSGTARRAALRASAWKIRAPQRDRLLPSILNAVRTLRQRGHAGANPCQPRIAPATTRIETSSAKRDHRRCREWQYQQKADHRRISESLEQSNAVVTILHTEHDVRGDGEVLGQRQEGQCGQGVEGIPADSVLRPQEGEDQQA